MPDSILIFGATSAIAKACALHWIANAPNDAPPSFALCARNPAKLDALAHQLRSHGANIAFQECVDAESFDPEKLPALFDRIWDCIPVFNTVLIAQGSMRSTHEVEVFSPQFHAEATVNFTFPAILALEAFRKLEAQPTPSTLAAISSVAGNFGRRSNYTYGATKAALSTLLQGLDARAVPSSVTVLDIRPGPTHSPMTAHLDPAQRFASPDAVARRILARIRSHKGGVLYAPAKWWLILSILSNLPRPIRRRLPF